MNNFDQGQFAALLYCGYIRMELIPSSGMELDTYYYEYSIFLPPIQKKLAGVDNLDSYEGIHQYDFEYYVGRGYTLKEAWEDFKSKVDIEMFLYAPHETKILERVLG